jgi:RTX calcium-binding nonapeptide repeat (4 copies)
MMNRRIFATLGVAGLILSGSGATAMATTPASQSAGATVICHTTRFQPHPYVAITVSGSILEAHRAHPDRQDIIPAPAGGCPSDPAPVPYSGPVIQCAVSAGVTQTSRTVTGTNGDDTIDSTSAQPRKRILGLAGNDTITGSAFADSIIGRDGNDTITGGPSLDYIQGNVGNDTLTGSGGADTLFAGLGNDTLSGGVGDDTLIARPRDASADTVNGNAGADTCTGYTPEGDTLTGCEM